ncbi:hypothetical protein MTO96_039824 [Rhipicephalus appendiculatus]
MALQFCLTAHVKWRSREGVADILSITLSAGNDALLALADRDTTTRRPRRGHHRHRAPRIGHLYRAANVPAHEAGDDTACANKRQNIIVVSTPHVTHASKYRQLQDITIGNRRHEVSAYATAPDYTVKGIIKGIPLEEDARSIHTNIIHTCNPHAVAAKRLSNTTTVIGAFEGPRVPTYVWYGCALLRCTLYRKQVDICHCCGILSHRLDVCPNPHDKVCRGCDAPNAGPEHQCSPPLQAVQGHTQ